MKRLTLFLLGFVMALNAQAFTAYAADNLELIINGEKQSCENIIVVNLGTGNNQMLAPAREISAAIGAIYTWNENENHVTLTKDNNTIVFTLDSGTALVNGSGAKLEIPAQLMEGTPFVPVEFCGRELGFHVFRERAGKRVRIVSRTSTAAPAAEDAMPGMAELVSEEHRPVPVTFEKTDALDDLIFNREDYSGAVTTVDPAEIGELPTGGEVILSQQDFINEMTSYADWINAYVASSIVDVAQEDYDERIIMKVKMAGQNIGEGNNNIHPVPFTQAIRVNSKYKPSNAYSSTITFSKQLPSPKKTDKYILTFYARVIKGGHPDYGTGKVQIQVQQPNGVEKSGADIAEFGPVWKRFDFLLTGVEDACKIRFTSAFEVQTVEVGGFEIRDVGEDADVSYFNKSKIDLLAPELAPDAPWRAEALKRIEEIRKGNFKVIVKDSSGNPVSGADVKFDMFEHEFKFGIMMDIEYVDDSILNGYIVENNGDKEKEFIARIGANFNALSIGNRLKWTYYAEDKMNNPGKTSTAQLVIDEAKKKGLKYVRGHALWMPNNSYTGNPQEMYDLLLDERDVDVRYNELLEFIENHFAEMNEKFPEIYEWDVTNETHGRTFFTDVFGYRIFNDVYRKAAEKLTSGQKLMLCDNRQFEDQYWERLDWFKEQGIEYDSLGMQGHSRLGSHDYDNNYRPTKWLEVWDRFAYEYQKNFAVTEFSAGSLLNEYGHDGQGDYLRDMLIAAFSHPACTGFNIWWLSDYWSEWDSPFRPLNPANNGNGAGVAPLYDYWFNAKPGLAQYQDLLYNKWWTTGAATTTNQNGEGTINGFFGDYDVTVTVNGEVVKTEMAAFHKGYDNVLTITLD